MFLLPGTRTHPPLPVRLLHELVALVLDVRPPAVLRGLLPEPLHLPVFRFDVLRVWVDSPPFPTNHRLLVTPSRQGCWAGCVCVQTSRHVRIASSSNSLNLVDTGSGREVTRDVPTVVWKSRKSRTRKDSVVERPKPNRHFIQIRRGSQKRESFTVVVIGPTGWFLNSQ